MPASRIAAALVGSAISCATSAAPHYTYLDIGPTLAAKQINGNGDVLGLLGHRAAIYVSSTGQWELLGDRNNYAPEALDNRDVVVGERNYGSQGRPHAVVFKRSGEVIDLVRARESYATVLRGDGTAYGVSQPFGGGEAFPFIWKGGRVTPLDSFAGYTWTMPVGATKSGEIAANGVNDPRGVICPAQPALYRGGAWHSLGSLGGTCGLAHGMNDLGDIVGWSTYEGDEHGGAFLWHDGVMTDIGTLGGGSAVAKDINSLGQVVGIDTDAAGDASWGFIYAHGVMTRLDDLVDDRPSDLTFFDAISINEGGQILAYGLTPTSLDTYVLTPTH
jgi:probable HAF family extracellular repeat protein